MIPCAAAVRGGCCRSNVKLRGPLGVVCTQWQRAASGKRNLNGSFTAMSLELCTSRADPQLPDDVCKGYGGFMIMKLPVKTVDWRSHPRPQRSSRAVRLTTAPHRFAAIEPAHVQNLWAVAGTAACRKWLLTLSTLCGRSRSSMDPRDVQLALDTVLYLAEDAPGGNIASRNALDRTKDGGRNPSLERATQTGRAGEGP